MKKLYDFLNEYNWEWLQSEKEIIPDSFSIRRDGDPRPFGESISSIRLWRDTQYQIQGCITGDIMVINKIQEYLKPTQNENNLKYTLSVSTLDTVYTLRGCITTNIRYHVNKSSRIRFRIDEVSGKILRSESDNVYQSEYDRAIPHLETHTELGSPVKLSIWYINGIRKDPAWIFSGITKTCINSSCTISNSSYTIQRTLSIPLQQSICRNATSPIKIDGIDTPLIIHTVKDDAYPPTWSRKMAFDYWKNADTEMFPDRDKWCGIGEVAGYLFGRELIPIGYTIYDKNGNIVEFSSIDVPTWKNLSLKSAYQDLPPIALERDLKKGSETPSPFETVFPPLAHQYLSTRDSLCLHEVLVRYWTGMSLPLGLNIPLIQNGIEILTKTSQGNDPARTKTRNYVEQFLKPMMKHFHLPLGTKEEKLSDLRNSMIHGMIDFNQGNIDDSTRAVYAYISFFHRIFLGALGYNGKYIDYSLSNPQSKDILIPVRDPISDPETQE